MYQEQCYLLKTQYYTRQCPYPHRIYNLAKLSNNQISTTCSKLQIDERTTDFCGNSQKGCCIHYLCCVTNYPKAYWLKIPSISYLINYINWEFRHGFTGLLWLNILNNVTAKVSAKAMIGSTLKTQLGWHVICFQTLTWPCTGLKRFVSKFMNMVAGRRGPHHVGFSRDVWRPSDNWWSERMSQRVRKEAADKGHSLSIVTKFWEWHHK